MLIEASGAVQIADDGKVTAQDGRDGSAEMRGLVLRAQAGDSLAFEQLMICFQRQVMGTAVRILRRHEEARDAAQEVFFKLYRYLPRLKPDAVRTWLYRVTVSVCCDMARKSERFPTSILEEDAGGEGFSVSGVEKADAAINLRERRDVLRTALQALPFKERAALVLRDVEGLSTEETARVLGSSAVTVRSQISSARVKVKHYCDRALGRAK